MYRQSLSFLVITKHREGQTNTVAKCSYFVCSAQLFPNVLLKNFSLLFYLLSVAWIAKTGGALTATQICQLPLNFSVCLWPNPPSKSWSVGKHTLKSKRGQCFRHGQRPVQNFNVSLFILRCLRTFHFSSENIHIVPFEAVP